MSRAEVIAAIGNPALTEERSGDVMRSYLPSSNPEYQWPEACARLYYLDDDMVVVIEHDRVKACSTLSIEDRARAIDTISQIQAAQEGQ